MPTFLSLKTKMAVLFNQTSILLYFATSAARFLPISIPRVPALLSSCEPKNLCVWRTSFPPKAYLSSISNVGMFCLPSSIAAESPAGPPPIIRTSVFTYSRGSKSKGVSIAGRTGSPSSDCTIIFSLTAVIQDFTAIPLAITLHWEH